MKKHRLGLNNLSNSQLSAINIIGSIIVVIINTLISFFLSPFIVKRIGIEANGYIMLANNFVSYLALIITAMNSMAGRFILIELHRNRIEEANKYYTSVLVGNYILGIVLLLPSVIFILFLESFIKIDISLLGDVKLLFLLVFSTFFISVFLPKWECATYATNRLYLRSIKSVIATVARATTIIFLFAVYKPAAYYVGIAGLIMTVLSNVIAYRNKKQLLPQLRINKIYYEFNKIKELMASGIWNSVTQCGNLLLEGLDLLIANLFIDATAMGILSLSKILPNMLNQLVGTIATTFAPKLTYLYADNDMDGLVNETKRNIKLLSIIATIPIGIILVYGKPFFSLWVPSQDSGQLALLSSISLIGILVSGISKCIMNIFGITNKLRTNSLVLIASGLLNIAVVYLLLRTTSLGLFAIAGVSSIIAIFREFIFTAPYAAKCIRKKPLIFHGVLIRSVLVVIIPIVVSLAVFSILPSGRWFNLFVGMAIAAIVSFLIDVIVILKKDERVQLHRLFKIRR